MGRTEKNTSAIVEEPIYDLHYDPTPSLRRIKPGVSGDELSDFTLFCGQLLDEGNRPSPRPGKRIKHVLPEDVWGLIESAELPMGDSGQKISMGAYETACARAAELHGEHPSLLTCLMRCCLAALATCPCFSLTLTLGIRCPSDVWQFSSLYFSSGHMSFLPVSVP